MNHRFDRPAGLLIRSTVVGLGLLIVPFSYAALLAARRLHEEPDLPVIPTVVAIVRHHWRRSLAGSTLGWALAVVAAVDVLTAPSWPAPLAPLVLGIGILLGLALLVVPSHLAAGRPGLVDAVLAGAARPGRSALVVASWAVAGALAVVVPALTPVLLGGAAVASAGLVGTSAPEPTLDPVASSRTV